MVLFAGCGSARSVALEDLLRNYINSKDAKIGVAVVIDGKLLTGMNEKDSFPMLSVFKFPLALTVAEKVRKSGCTFDDSLSVKA
ncbi:MAG: serine hydrolase, partial [Prevotella sp.]|nr:serine hydrolase [Prevotella sp.]